MPRTCSEPRALVTLLLLAGCGPGPAAPPAGPPPHVVLIVADDLGWSDVGYHGAEISTPHIDRLAHEGVRLERFYVSPICSPTRAALLTGRYPIRFGLARSVIAPWRDFGLDPEETTLPQVLAGAGYRHRALFGKWHLGHLRREWHPLERGFTHFRGHYNGAIDYLEHTREGQRDWHLDFEPLVEEGYSTDLIADAAARFIEARADEGPLLVVASFNAPHAPFMAPEAYLARYEHLRGPDGEPSLRQLRAAMISCMDDGIGRILAALERAGIADQTLVWFLSDNGASIADPAANRPLRSGKYDLLEGGIRVPACVRWPRVLPAGLALETPTAVQDILPTLLQAAGIEEHGGRPLDGLGLLDLLRGERRELERTLLFYVGHDGEEREQLAAIDWPWKLVLLGPSLADSPPGPEHWRLLFDLQADPTESVDVAAQHPQVVEALTARLVAFRRLQPERSVAPYEAGRKGFVAPQSWALPAPR